MVKLVYRKGDHVIFWSDYQTHDGEIVGFVKNIDTKYLHPGTVNDMIVKYNSPYHNFAVRYVICYLWMRSIYKNYSLEFEPTLSARHCYGDSVEDAINKWNKVLSQNVKFVEQITEIGNV